MDIGDEVQHGQVIARLDDAELRQQVQQQQAAVQVARASLAEARTAATIAEREYERISSLAQNNATLQSALDQALLALEAARGRLAVSESEMMREEASLRSAEVRLGYAEVRADWQEGDTTRVVGERFANEGDTLSANEPLVSIVDIATLRAVVNVTERDYPRLAMGMPGELRAEPFPGEAFPAEISRLAPVFQSNTRQARIEAMVPNTQGRLKPGMFATLNVQLRRIEAATVAPTSAVVRREGHNGVFVVR